jgi:NADH dehydrogenase FAD-containing subunit
MNPGMSPEISPEISRAQRIVVIGGGAAGIGAASWARSAAEHQAIYASIR